MLDHLTNAATKDHLTKARMATLLREAKSTNSVAFREEVLSLLYATKVNHAKVSGARYRKPKQEEIVVHANTLDALLGDLLWASNHVEALGACYRSSDRQAFTDGATKASSRAYEWQVPLLRSLGLIDLYIGFIAWDDFDGDSVQLYRFSTRIRATPALIVIAQRHGITSANLADHYHERPSKLTRLIVLRGGKYAGKRGRVLKCPDTKQATAVRSQVERINTIYARHDFGDLRQPQVYRLFNCADAEGFAFNKGGRLYGDYQSLESEQRRQVTINGQPAVELDLKASQLTILCGVTGTPLPDGDPYAIEGVPREVVKGVVTAMIGLGHPNLRQWSSKTKATLLVELGDGQQPMNPKTFGKRYAAKAMAAKVLKRHPVLHHLSPGRLDWADLQFLESEVLIAAILELGEKYGIPALPVHDSLIVPEDAVEIAQGCLSRSFHEIVGVMPRIVAK